MKNVRYMITLFHKVCFRHYIVVFIVFMHEVELIL